MSVLDRDALSDSPLADLQAIASELGIDGYRRLRKAELVDAIIERQGGEPAGDDEDAGEKRPARRRRGRGRDRAAADDEEGEKEEKEEKDEDDDDEPARPARRSRGGRGGRSERSPRSDRAPRGERPSRSERSERDDRPEREERTAEGVVELLPNGSGFIRANSPEQSDDDVYISAAQVRRCELVSGDTVSGPVRPRRRSERFASLARVDTINGKPADEVAEGTRYDDLPAAFPAERIELGSEDPTLRAIEWLTPFGKGSRVTIVGGPRAGKTEALRLLAAALAAVEGLEVSTVLAGARPEEISEWSSGPVEPVAALSFAAGTDAQGQAVDQAVEHGRRIAARGGDAVVLIDTLDGLAPAAARKALAAARNIADGGSLTVLATSSRPLGGETTVIALDARLTAARSFPALDLLHSGTLRAEALVGEKGAEAIAKARAEA